MTEDGAHEKFISKDIYDALTTSIRAGHIRSDDCIPSRWQALLPNGRHAESDILSRERPDLLVEFATGSTRLAQHIMHMHGRACAPESMIVGRRDYDSLYRKTDITTLPFEHARQLLFSGNPILFLGLGMEEAEVNAALQTYVSNNPYRYLTPNFLLWNSHRFPQDNRDKRMFAKRIAWLQSLGVMVIFDEDLEDPVLHEQIESVRVREQGLVKCQQDWDSFNTAIPGTALGANLASAKAVARLESIALLPATVEALAQRVAKIWQTSKIRPTEWRSMRLRFTNTLQVTRQDRTYLLWSRKASTSEAQFDLNSLGDMFSTASPVVRVLLGEPGSGKGSLARFIVEEAGSDVDGRQYLLINAGFSFDTDSLLNALKHFMFKVKDPDSYDDSGKRPTFPGQSREQFFCNEDSFEGMQQTERDALIVVNGMERFFSVDGRPLSGELDHILRSIAKLGKSKSRFSFVFLGTGRAKRYFETILSKTEDHLTIFEIVENNKNRFLTAPDKHRALATKEEGCGSQVNSDYFWEIEQKFWGMPKSGAIEHDAVAARKKALPFSDITIIDSKGGADIDSLRRAFFRAYLDPAVLDAGGIENPELALEILRTLAFVGAPVEAIVLAHVPSIRDRISKKSDSADIAISYVDILTEISVCLQTLADKHLVVPVQAHEAYPKDVTFWNRYGLHKTLLKEIRTRHGIPLSPAKRSTAFNMSLYASQPLDGDSPEPQVHEELGVLVDRLIGAYKDFQDPTGGRSSVFIGHEELVKSALEAASLELPSPVKKADAFLLYPETSAALRAALAVIRGYYSTTSLLRIDRHDRHYGEETDGALLDHAERLNRLLRGYRKVVKARSCMRANIQSANLNMDEQRVLIEKMGPEPFYRDELVWLYNEMGVVQLTMGNLYEAETALNQAVDANTQVEFGHPSHNWRRITLNFILLDIERARLIDAQQKIEAVERAIDERKTEWKAKEPSKPTRVKQIIWAYGEKHTIGTDCFDTDIMHEEMLAIGLTRGFRGLCAHLGGRLADADEDYTTSINILRRIGEQRAYALFLRRHGELKRAIVAHGAIRRRFRTPNGHFLSDYDGATSSCGDWIKHTTCCGRAAGCSDAILHFAQRYARICPRIGHIPREGGRVRATGAVVAS
jgi:SIR2-like domain